MDAFDPIETSSARETFADEVLHCIEIEKKVSQLLLFVLASENYTRPIKLDDSLYCRQCVVCDNKKHVCLIHHCNSQK